MSLQVEDGSVLELLFQRDTFKERSRIEEPRAHPAGAGETLGAPSHWNSRESLCSGV